MNDELADRDPDPPVLRMTVSELRHALDSLTERLSRLERASGGAADTADRRGADSDERTLALFQEILSLPAVRAGLPPRRPAHRIAAARRGPGGSRLRREADDDLRPRCLTGRSGSLHRAIPGS